jgi:hypothetical protein
MDPDKPAQLGSVERLGAVWDDFRAGGVVYCEKDAGPLALAVDAGANSYRFVCTSCGNASPWFESGPAGIRIRSTLSNFSATLGED